jgi:hypothetical protein
MRVDFLEAPAEQVAIEGRGTVHVIGRQFIVREATRVVDARRADGVARLPGADERPGGVGDDCQARLGHHVVYGVNGAAQLLCPGRCGVGIGDGDT